MDFEKFGAMYDTSAGVGITGSMVPNVEVRGRSMWWLAIPLAGFVMFWFYFGTIAKGFRHMVTAGLVRAVPGMQQKMAVAMNIPRTAIAAVGGPRAAGGVPPILGQPTLQKDAPADNEERNIPLQRPENAQKLPIWNLEGATNLQVTGWFRSPKETRIFLSNGRQLPIKEVAVVNDYCVLLFDGTRLPVAVVKDGISGPEQSQEVEKYESSGYSGLSPAVMSLNTAGAGRIHGNVVDVLPSP